MDKKPEPVIAFVPEHGRGLLRPWQPGESGNPGGRPKGLMARVQTKLGKDRDGKKLVDGLYVIAFGTADQREKFFKEPVEVTAKERLRAMELLADRGWGRPYVPEDDTPFMPTTGAGPTLVFNIPRPPKELEGRTTVEVDPAETSE